MFKNILIFMNVLFMYYIFIYSIIFFISTIYSIINMNNYIVKRRFKNIIKIEKDKNYMPISVIVPAYNEEKTIINCIKSLKKLDYPIFEIIIVNDGSKDDTKKRIIEEFNLKKIERPIRRVVNCKDPIDIYESEGGTKITLVNKDNGGKADALNLGINISKYPYFVSLDADSMLQENSLKNIMEPIIEDDRTIAVGGNIKGSNSAIIEDGKVKKLKTPRKFIVIFQFIEYYRVFLVNRILFNRFNGNLIISGAFGLFKKQAVINVGGYSLGSIGEDMDLIVKLHSFYRKNRVDYKVQYAPNAICWSEVPERYKDLKNQRKRWHIGLIQSLLSHKYIFLNIKYGIVGLFSFIYYVIYEMLSCVIEVIGLVVMVLSYSIGIINWDFFKTFMFMYITYSFILSTASIILEGYMFKDIVKIRTIIKLIIFSFFESFGYRQLCSFYRIMGIISYKRRKFEWEKIQRIDYLNESKNLNSDVI
ncbi:glycosyltransferase [Eubacterium multiforme]|uniref:Cellulose synthase/poly-beta-1,6-N-acetylglucosamine synthase-like glycosyltransferase n=1 Tax=Eubacterium multiforme TaxID=83339 RepID=A0ABT9UWR9_9FIRM|nr:glycosyltransferase [Eubacterium multiforme]MDQ0150767.1 cellulose synthase/poly-beta-1,6-N-acetylglucosamine synthase-like glycosyltransferase [Eubacterium multiforme]